MAPKRNFWTPEEDKALIELYGNISHQELEQRFPTHSRSAIRSRAHVLRQNGEDVIKHERRLYDVNFNYFDKVDIEQCAMAGLVASDGCILPKKNKVQITSKDTDYLEMWREKVEYTGPIHTYAIPETAYGKGSVSILMIYGVPLWVKSLAKIYNITSKKSLTLQPPNIVEKDHVLAFMSGYIDGDGSIMYKVRSDTRAPSWTIAFCGTEMMCFWFKGICDRYYPSNRIYKGIEKSIGKNIWQYRIGGKRALMLASDILQLDVPRLERKWCRIESHLNSNLIPQ